MILTNPRYVWQNKVPQLHVDVDGRTVVLDTAVKPDIHRYGQVALGEGLGVVRDPKLFRLYDIFLQAVASRRFYSGPVSIPI